MSLLRCPGAASLGWGTPQEEDEDDEREKREGVKSKTERKGAKGAEKTEKESLSFAKSSEEDVATSLGPAKKRRINEEKNELQKDEQRIHVANDNIDAIASADSPTAADSEVTEVERGSVVEDDENSTATEAQTETSAAADDSVLSTDEDGSAIIAFSPPGSEIVITGMATVTVLGGKVEIMGCAIDCTDECPSVQICSPDGGWASALTIVDVSSSNVASNESTSSLATGAQIRIDSLSWNGHTGADAGMVSKTFHITQRSEVRSALLIADRWRSTADVVISDLKKTIDVAKKNGDQLPDPSRVLVCGAKGVGKSTYVRYLLNKVISSNGSQSGDNCLSRKRRRVAVLDCDVGQPELGPPGLITLTVLEKPLLSPPHVHMMCGKEGEDESSRNENDGHPCFAPSSGHASARFFGHISAKADPSSYTAAIASLMDKYEELVNDALESDSVAGESEQITRMDALPLVVNTAGWVKGMGFEILSSIVDVVRPGHIVQIVGATRAKFFDLTPHAFEGRSIHVVEAFGSVSKLPTDQETTPPPSRAVSPVPPSAEASKQSNGSADTVLPMTGNTGASGSTSSASTGTLRELRLSSYFLGGFKHLLDSGAKFWPASGGIYDPHCYVASTLAAAKPFCVPFHSVFCSVPSLMEYRGTAQADELIMKSLNGSIVGLCHWRGAVRKENHRHQNDVTAAIQTTPPYLDVSLLPCMGLGIVRAMDRVKQCFYILTPVAPEELMKSPPNVLVRGMLQLPLTCAYRGVHSESLPYQNCDCITSGTGDDIMKSKNAPAKPAPR